MNSLKVKENTFLNLRSSFFCYCGLTRSKNGPLENSNNNKYNLFFVSKNLRSVLFGLVSSQGQKIRILERKK